MYRFYNSNVLYSENLSFRMFIFYKNIIWVALRRFHVHSMGKNNFYVIFFILHLQILQFLLAKSHVSLKVQIRLFFMQ